MFFEIISPLENDRVMFYFSKGSDNTELGSVLIITVESTFTRTSQGLWVDSDGADVRPVSPDFTFTLFLVSILPTP